MSQQKKIAAIVTTYYPASHADVIVTKFLKGFPTDEDRLPPQVELVSMYLDQIHERDIGLGLAREHGVRVCRSIVEALTLGSDELAVDGALLIGEHGDYAWNERDQHLYPRRYFFEQACGVIARADRPVPLFNDKHLAYNWHDARWMVDRAQELGVPFLAGSSLPLAWRHPWLEHPLDTPLSEALVVAYGGIESYGYHALELLQCMVERRRGGETGIHAVRCVEDDTVWRTLREGRFSRDLLDAALESVEDKQEGEIAAHCPHPLLFLLDYRDGLSAAVLLLNGYLQGWGYAASVEGEIQNMEVLLPGPPYAHFSYLCLNIQQMFLTGQPPYPVQRTLIVSGALDALMASRYLGHRRVETPYLDIRYRSYETPPIRPSRPRPEGPSLMPLN